MATAVQSTPTLANGTNGVNGTKSNVKIKSKNQLRRLKAKQKKAEQATTVRPVHVATYTRHLTRHATRKAMEMRWKESSRRMGISL